MTDGYEPMDSKTLEIELMAVKIELYAAFERMERGETQTPQRKIIVSAFEPPQHVETRLNLKTIDNGFSEYISDFCI